MTRLLTLVVAVVLLATLTPAVPAAQQPAFTGRWEGTILINGQSVTIVVAVTDSTEGLKGTIDVPQQNAKGLPLLNVRYTAPKVHFELQGTIGLATFDGELNADRVTGTLEQPGVKGTFELKRATASQVPAPPPEPVPYLEEEVKIQNGPITLAGTLTLPPSGGPFPAAVMITGSGAQNRDEELVGFKPFRVIADHLTRQGIAVLRCDDRGIGGSSGTVADSTSADFAGDVIAEVQFLKGHTGIDKAHIGVLGHSEGGLVGPLAASQSKDIAFVIMMSGPALTGEKILLAQGELIGRASGKPEADIKKNVEIQHLMFAAVRTGTGWDAVADAIRAETRVMIDRLPEERRKAIPNLDAVIEAQVTQELTRVRAPWFKYFLDYDPAPALEKARVPLLAVFGELDLQVPTEANRVALEAALKKGGNRDYTIKVFPKANHLYQEANTGNATEYATLKKEFVPGLLDLYSSWILQHAGKK
jgi:pimeloyl-ACP methyl ester carboxylesterase